MMNNPMSMSRMSQQQLQQQQQQPGMNCPPGSTNGSGMMSNGPDLQPQQQQMSMNQQNFSNNQYHQVTVEKGRLITIKYMCLYL